MATVFKTFLNDDIATTRTLLHEAIPVHGGIVHGVYPEPDEPGKQEETNIKNYPHKMFQSVYDYPYLSSSANHIFDLTVGYAAAKDNDEAYIHPWTNDQQVSHKKKQKIYYQMAQVLVGHGIEGDILLFDEDGDILAGGDKYENCLYISIARLLNKDEVKKGSFFLHLDVGPNVPVSQANSDPLQSNYVLLVTDEGSENDYRVNSPAGDYGILRARTWSKLDSNGEVECEVPYDPNDPDYAARWAASSDDNCGGVDDRVGLIYYQAGVIVLSPHAFLNYDPAESSSSSGSSSDSDSGSGLSAIESAGCFGKLPVVVLNANNSEVGCMAEHGEFEPVIVHDDSTGASFHIDDAFRELDIPTICTGFRKRMVRMAFNNTTELNSTIYFCRVNHNDFNYSSNPTYLDASKIRVKDSTVDAPVAYITTIGLYSADNELLAVAKLSEALRKDPTNEIVLRVRLDY